MLKSKSLSMFGANIYLLIGLLVAAVVVVVLIVACWTTIKVAWWRRAQRRSLAAYHAQRFGPDGRPRPPTTRGICQVCGQRSDTIHHLPSGRRLCTQHYDAVCAAREAAAGAATEQA